MILDYGIIELFLPQMLGLSSHIGYRIRGILLFIQYMKIENEKCRNLKKEGYWVSILWRRGRAWDDDESLEDEEEEEEGEEGEEEEEEDSHPKNASFPFFLCNHETVSTASSLVERSILSFSPSVLLELQRGGRSGR